MIIPPRLSAWIKGHPYTLAWGVALLVLAVPFYLRHESEWEDVYVLAAQRLASGAGLYRAVGENYLYPPFMAALALPFTQLSPGQGRAAWLALNLAGLVFLVVAAWRLAGGGPLQKAGALRHEHLAAVLGAACGLGFAQNCLAHQQTDVLIGALLVGGCLCLLRERFLAGATCLGLAAACKCTPLLFLPYLLYRRRPIAAGWLVIVAGGVSLLPDLLAPAPSGRPWLAEYGTRWLRPLAQPDHQVGTWGSELGYNQSLAGGFQRWTGTTWAWGEKECAVEARPAPVGPLGLRALVYGTGLLLLFGAAWAAGRPFRALPGAAPGEVPPCALECGMVLALALLLSPMSSKAHFGVLVVPGFCLARAVLRSRHRPGCVLLGAVIVLAFLGNKGPLGPRLYTLSLWYGATTFTTLLLLLGCGVLRWRQRRTALPESAPAHELLQERGQAA